MYKKTISVLLCVLLAAVCLLPAAALGEVVTPAGFGAYDHVFIIGVDGAGSYFSRAETPNFDRIFASGAVDYTARAETITTSAQNWGAILTGVSYLQHGLTNEITGSVERASDTQYPSIFCYARSAFPEAELASFVNWNPINYGIIENDIGVTKVNVTDDAALTDAICAYFDEGNAPKLFFVQFDSVDHVGHDVGSNSPDYVRQIETVDGYLGSVYDSIERNGLMENGLFIVVADHGHVPTGGHGGITMRETNVTLAVAGKNVVSGGRMDKNTRNRDVSAIALYALGIERPDHMTSRLPADLFTGVKGEIRNRKNDLGDTILSMLAWIVTLLTKWI